jgi:hypothetical protein
MLYIRLMYYDIHNELPNKVPRSDIELTDSKV